MQLVADYCGGVLLCAQPETMRRKADPGSLQDGVTLLVGKTTQAPHAEKVGGGAYRLL
jgi:hypothetical protein